MTIAFVNFNTCIGNLINKTMFIVYSSAPIALQVAFERFRFTQSGKRIFLNIFYQIKDFKNKLLLAGFKEPQFSDSLICKLDHSHDAKFSRTYCLNSSIVKVLV